MYGGLYVYMYGCMYVCIWSIYRSIDLSIWSIWSIYLSDLSIYVLRNQYLNIYTYTFIHKHAHQYIHIHIHIYIYIYMYNVYVYVYGASRPSCIQAAQVGDRFSSASRSNFRTSESFGLGAGWVRQYGTIVMGWSIMYRIIWLLSKPWHLVNPKIAGKWMFIPLRMVLIGIDPYPYGKMWDYIYI